MKTYTIRQTLSLIVFALIIPACLIAIGFSVKAYYDGRDSVTSLTLQTARAMTFLVERELVGLKGATEALAFSGYLQTNNLDAFYLQAESVLRTTTGFTFVLTDLSGQQIVNTLKPYGSVLPRAGDPALIERVFTSGKPIISNLYLGGVTKKPILSISAPVFKNGKLAYALDLGFLPSNFSKIIAAQNISQDWIVTIFDSNGTIVARNIAEDKFRGKPGAPDLLRQMAIKPQGIAEITTLDGMKAFSMFSRSPTTGWSVAISVPTAVVNAGLWRSLWLSIFATIMLLPTGMLFARFAGRRISSAILTLGPHAASLGRGENLPVPALALKEAADIVKELTKTNDVLQRIEHERKLAEQALHETEQRYAAIYASTPLAIALSTLPGGTLVSVNDAFLRLFGCTKEEAIGVTTVNVPVMDADTHHRVEASLLQHGTIRNFEYSCHTKSGTVIDLSINVDRVSIDGQTFSLTTTQDVTETRLAQKERANLAAIIDSAKDAIIGTRLDSVITSWNQGAEQLFGYRAAEAIGRSVLDVVYAAGDEPEEPTILAKIVRGETVSNFATGRRHKNGSLIDVSVAVSPIRNSQGVIVGAARTLRDMSAEVAINKRLQESERQLSIALETRTVERDDLEQRVTERTKELARTLHFNEAVLHHSPLPMVVFKESGQCVMLNEAYLNIIGATREQALAQNYKHIVSWQKTGLLVDAIETLKREKIIKREVHVTSTFGREVWIACDLVAIYLDNEKHLLMQAFDLTERKQADHQLRIVATAFESQQPMMITNAEKVILQVNGALSACTGFASEELVGLTPPVFRSGHHDARFYDALWNSIDRDDSWNGEIWDQRKDGEFFPNWVTITAVRNPSGEVTNYVATQIDITARKETEEEIRLLAFFDPLTNLPNRRLLMDLLRQALATSSRSGRSGAVMLIDLDNFKTLNDTLGHDLGDALLRQVAERLPSCVRGGDTVARLGGDEFIVLLEELSEESDVAVSQARLVGEKILDVLNQSYNLKGHTHRSSSSIGITMFSRRHNTIDELLKRADLAMYEAKAAGRSAMRFFEAHMQDSLTAHAQMEAELHLALERDEFVLHYQAQVDNQNCITGVEALVRWNHPQRGQVPPFEFIPVAEETGLILPLGSWVLEAACHQLAEWSTTPSTAALTMAVNVSGLQFRRPDFVAHVLDILTRTGANSYRLKLEITESLLLDNMDDIISKMSALRQHGISFSLDDFGTGYSSLSYLKLLPLDQLKIDRSFVRDILTDPNDAAIARTILALGQTLGLAVIAEGVETQEQQNALAENGCDAYQGYLFSRPVAVSDFEKLLQQRQFNSAVIY